MRRRDFLSAGVALALAPGFSGPRAGALADGRPSRTAEATARERAVHQLLEVPPVFEDPWALRILGAERVRALALDLDRHREPYSRNLRAHLVLRSRHAEEALARAVREDVRQYVVLGAGLDTFGLRNANPRLRVFEVDHPSTQRWKRAWLAASGTELPRTLAFAPVDFERESLADGLRRARFRFDQPAYCSWLGVTMYLSPEAVRGTLRAVAGWPRGSGIAFDVLPPARMLDAAERRTRAQMAARVASIGEPWRGEFDPYALAREMEASGYRSAAVLDGAQANAQYFDGRGDGFRVTGASFMVTAHV